MSGAQVNFPWLADHVVDVHKKDADPVARADAHLAKITRWLAGEYVKAIAVGREALPLAELERLIVEAAGSGIFKADELPALAWNEAVNLDMRLLGRPYVIVHIEVPRFDRIWERRGAHYVADAGMALLEAIAKLARSGVMLPPPVVADLGNAEWAFLDGRNRYLYARAARMKVIPVAVPQEDAARLKNAAGLALPAATGGGAVPAGGLSRPYADLSDAIEHVGLLIANRFYSAVMAAGIASGEREAVRLARMLDVRQRTAKLETAIDFETPNTGALAELRLSSMRLIREFSDEQRSAVLAALRDGVARGVNPKEMARLFRGVVGLTSAQEAMVQNYQRALERAATDAAARANALGRALRDGRFDRTVAAAGRSGVPLTPEKIQQMVGRYRERFINMRATTIARTEALRAVHMSERAVWEEAVRRGDIAANEVEETWNAAHDSRTRNTHRLLDKQQRPMGTPFQSISGAKLRFPGDPLAPAAETVNCRCVITRNISAEPVQSTEAVDAEGNPLPSDLTLVSDAAGGTKPKQIWVDSRGVQYLFKPVKAGDDFMVDAEIIGSKLSRRVNPDAPEVFAIRLNDRLGSMQRIISNTGDLSGVAIDQLVKAEVAAIQREHVVDWLIANHDGHAKQFIRLKGAGKAKKVVGIDKGQAFKHLGQDKLSIDYHPNAKFGEAEPIYNTLWRKYATDAKFRASVDLRPTFDAVKQLQKISDDDFRALLTPYAEKRFAGRPHIAEMFLDAAVERKTGLEVDFRKFFMTLDDVEARAGGSSSYGMLSSDDKRRILARARKYAPDITEAEALAIFDYTGNSFGPINQGLREATVWTGRQGKLNLAVWEKSAQRGALLDRALDKMPAYQGVVYRGINLHSVSSGSLDYSTAELARVVAKDYSIGKAIRFPHFTSSSHSGPTYGSTNVQFIIESKNGRLIEGVSSHGDVEKEVLFKSNSRFIVRKVETKDAGYGRGQATIYLEEADEIDFS